MEHPDSNPRRGARLTRRRHAQVAEGPERHKRAGLVSAPPSTPRGLSALAALYERDFPVYRQPVEVGCFSLDARRTFFNDARQLRYYVEPRRRPELNLRDGYRDRYLRRDEAVKENLDHMLTWILANRTKVQKGPAAGSSSLELDVDIITWRGHLTKLLTTPYETQEGWQLAVTKFGSTLYISEVETEAARQSRESRTERHKEMMYWGYKFEQYTCADDAGSRPDASGVVNTNEAFCTVIQTRLGTHKLLFSGEVDCRDPDPSAPPPPSCYIELKTSAEICTSKQHRNFLRYKLLKWWAQSFLPGVPRIVAGFRDNDGIVVSVETYYTLKISQLIKSEYNTWKPTVCMNFLYLFSWEPNMDVTYTVHRNSRYTFLPDWYVRQMMSPPT
ncbi:decapping and exoribonuclease protein [Arapaima gigas]